MSSELIINNHQKEAPPYIAVVSVRPDPEAVKIYIRGNGGGTFNQLGGKESFYSDIGNLRVCYIEYPKKGKGHKHPNTIPDALIVVSGLEMKLVQGAAGELAGLMGERDNLEAVQLFINGLINNSL